MSGVFCSILSLCRLLGFSLTSGKNEPLTLWLRAYLDYFTQLAWSSLCLGSNRRKKIPSLQNLTSLIRSSWVAQSGVLASFVPRVQS